MAAPEGNQFAVGNEGGRPPEYRPEFVELARNYCSLGATVRELAEFFKVTDRTIYNWQNEYPNFAEALRIGKDAPDQRVVRSLYERAVGYSFDSEKLFYDKDAGKVVRAKTVEHCPPDVGAGVWWTKNRLGWRDKHELTGPDGEPLYSAPPIIQIVAYDDEKDDGGSAATPGS